MKIRLGFVSNSSSTSFTIVNKSKELKTITDFVKENPQLIEGFLLQYDWHKDDPKYTQENLIDSSEGELISFEPGKSKVCTFGDEYGTLIGEVFDYMLRDGGESESFTWEFLETNR